MFKNKKKITLYLWVETQDNITYPEVKINPMPNDAYNPRINAKEFASLIMDSMPGNTLDILLNSIANEIIPLLTPVGIEILKSPYDIQNRVRGALYHLMNLKANEDD